MPGCIAGAFVADLPSMGPKKTLAIGVVLQGIIGFIMAGCYPWLSEAKNVGGFVVVYGVFLALGVMAQVTISDWLLRRLARSSIR